VFETRGKPIVLGHESAGVVHAIGRDVRHLAVGDRVAIEPGVPCRMCHYCKTGRYNLCEDIRFLATPPYDGSLATFHIHAADFCYKLPDSVTLEEGALLEPLSVGLHAVNRLRIAPGDCVLVFGSGPIGLVSLLAARASGAAFVIVTDIRDERLAVAKELGASLTLRVDSPDFLVNLKTLAPPVDISIECSGAESAIKTAIRATRGGGKVGLIGRGAKPEQSIPLFEAADREVDIIGIFRYANSYPRALSMVTSKQIDVRKLVTHHYPFENILEAFEVAETGRDGAIKVMFDL